MAPSMCETEMAVRPAAAAVTTDDAVVRAFAAAAAGRTHTMQHADAWAAEAGASRADQAGTILALARGPALQSGEGSLLTVTLGDAAENTRRAAVESVEDWEDSEIQIPKRKPDQQAVAVGGTHTDTRPSWAVQGRKGQAETCLGVRLFLLTQIDLVFSQSKRRACTSASHVRCSRAAPPHTRLLLPCIAL